MSVTDRGLSNMHGFSAKVRLTLTRDGLDASRPLHALADEGPNDFCKVGIVTLTLTSVVM